MRCYTHISAAWGGWRQPPEVVNIQGSPLRVTSTQLSPSLHLFPVSSQATDICLTQLLTRPWQCCHSSCPSSVLPWQGVPAECPAGCCGVPHAYVLLQHTAPFEYTTLTSCLFLVVSPWVMPREVLCHAACLHCQHWSCMQGYGEAESPRAATLLVGKPGHPVVAPGNGSATALAALVGHSR